MRHNLKIFSTVNLLAVTIPLFFLVVFLINPSFGNPLLLVALIGELFMVAVIIVGISFILFRKALRHNIDFYFAIGLLSISSGITALVTEIASAFDQVQIYLPFTLALLGIGIFIFLDTYKINKRSPARKNYS